MKRVFVSSLFLTLLVGAVYYFYLVLPDVSELKEKNPKTTAFMELRDKEYRSQAVRPPRRQSWVPYSAISDHLKRAILISEDAAFFSHRGVDLNELRESLKKVWETLTFARGGSTITMQLARNLYLSPSKNPLRKAKEIVIAHQLEHHLPKRRIFEIYLNVVEWGHHIYGAEAAARFYFGKPAAAIDPVEAATLAALLPNPRMATEPGILNRRNRILSRLASVGHITEEEHRRLRQAPLFNRVENSAPALREGA